MWVGEHRSHFDIAGSFTHESKLHLYHKSVQDLNHSQLIHKERPLWDHDNHNVSVGSRFDPSLFHKIHAAATKNENNK